MACVRTVIMVAMTVAAMRAMPFVRGMIMRRVRMIRMTIGGVRVMRIRIGVGRVLMHE